MSTVSLRLGGASFRLARRVVLVNLLLALSVLVLLLSGLVGGTYPIQGADVVAAFQGAADPITSMVVLENRLPRVVTALGVGLAFGLAGEMMQTLLRNPIASPDIIGFTAGAGCGAVFTVAFLGTSTLVVPGALAGGLLSAALVIGLSWQRGISPGQLVITGIGVTMTLGVVTDLLPAWTPRRRRLWSNGWRAHFRRAVWTRPRCCGSGWPSWGRLRCGINLLWHGYRCLKRSPPALG